MALHTSVISSILASTYISQYRNIAIVIHSHYRPYDAGLHVEHVAVGMPHDEAYLSRVSHRHTIGVDYDSLAFACVVVGVV